MSIVEIAKSTTSCLIKAENDTTSSRIWFKSKPVDRTFCYRAAQLQLSTDSSDQGYTSADTLNPGSWSWFEIVILPDEDSDTPRSKGGKELAWRSHGNRSDPEDTSTSLSRCFGKIFDRREEILDALEVGNVIAVRVCARYSGWVNNALQGSLYVKILNEDLFSPMSWTLCSAVTPDIPRTIENGVYTFTPKLECHVRAKNCDIASEIWFTTPVLDQFVLDKVEDIQLFTTASHQVHVSDGVEEKWSWFDLVILASPESREPRVKDGCSLVWMSHRTTPSCDGSCEQRGKLFSSQHEILRLIEPGNVIGVRVCAEFSGWESHAHSGRLVVRISNKGPRRAPSPLVSDWKSITRYNARLQEKLQAYLRIHSVTSVESKLLSRELRADLQYGAGDRPLRLLSLDGGGVRGISSLYILKDIMSRVSGDPNAKPCDYFDMIAGTSTGGLIAIMLGRLRMTVDQCIEAYERLASKIFSEDILTKINDWARFGARYSDTVLENAIKEIVKQYAGDEDAPMRDPSENPCKVFVLAVQEDNINNRLATYLRTYTNPATERSFADYKIWEAARATSAAPTYFRPMKLGGHKYVDGGLGFNNPVLLLMCEARIYYGSARRCGTLLTLGTGMTQDVSLPPDGDNMLSNFTGTAKSLYDMSELALESEQSNRIAGILATGRYYRFNIEIKSAEKKVRASSFPSIPPSPPSSPPSLFSLFSLFFSIPLFGKLFGRHSKRQIDLDDYKRMDALVQMTKEYIKEEAPRLAECAATLSPKHVE